ncbi:MAG: DUF4012 domain-containing protein [candidate division SR1 bacterium]|nr:DUF4012 domain-containing protein [candidate division SR1 bacterium]
MPNYKTSYLQKLQKLKKSPEKEGFTSILLKNQLRQGFFILITIFFITVVTLASFLSRVEVSKTQFAQNNSFLNLKLKSLFELNILDRESSLKTIKKTLLESVKPTTDFFNVEWLIDKDLSAVENLATHWFNAIDPLKEYNFTAEGFISRLDQNKIFTSDLELFFDQLPELQIETEKVWNNMWAYKIIIATSGNEKAKSLISLIDSFISSIPKIIQSKSLLLKILGHYSTQRMVIFNQNVGEARPTGGFIGSHIPVDISQGKINLGESQSIYFVDGQTKQGIISHPSIWYSNKDEGINSFGGIRNLNVFNCFPNTASVLEQEFSASSNGYSIDQLVMINPQIIQNILPDDFSFYVNGVGNINKENFVREIERISSIEAPNKLNPKSLLSPVFKSLIEKMPDIIREEGLSTILSKLLDSFYSRDLNIWFRDSNIQNLSIDLGFASEQVCDYKNKNIVTPLILNISGDKRNLISSNRFAVQSKGVWGGRKISISYVQNLPESKNLQRNFNDVYPFTMIGLQIPKNSFDIKIQSDRLLKLAYKRENYLNAVTQEENKIAKIPSVIQTTIDTGRDLENGGFTYNQADGSLVAGAYISDNNVGQTVVNFEFTVPMQAGDRIDFFGQPGLNEPSLFLGEGIDIYKNQNIREVTDPQIIQSGVTLVAK